MATIKKRNDKNGKTRYQAIIRLKGCSTQTAAFSKITKPKGAPGRVRFFRRDF